MGKDVLVGGLVGISLLFFMGFLFYAYGNVDSPKGIDSFEACANAPGSVIMESYPEQCRTQGGKTFVNETQREDLDKDLRSTCGGEGKWLEEYGECEGVSEGWCNKSGGSFDECTSACRHNVDPGAPCILLCVPVCEF
ncbi:MAG: hypothetical protein Q8P99_00065 [bacterium]|nr:hypothetical protein [bacterium]MDZ4231550.1 hypothetical protein [Patescibacteria group bacterium]